MTISIIPDFTNAEQKLVSTRLFKHNGKLVPMQLADAELQLGLDSERVTTCPTSYWSQRSAHFVV